MNKDNRFAIVGCGKVGQIHAEILRSLSNTSFVAVCDKSEEKAKQFSDQFHVNAYTDVGEMVKAEEVDIAIICTPHPLHALSALPAIENGAHVLIEKPLASSLKDCDLMIAAAEEKNVKLGVVSQRRFYPPVQRIKEAISDGKIGKPILGIVMMLGWRDKEYYNVDPWRGTWVHEGGGVLVNQACHQLDLFQWFMGPIDHLYGIWDNFNHPYIEVDDTAIATVKFKNGALGNIIVSNSQMPGLYGKVHVHGENGSSIGVQTDGGAMFIAGMTEITEPPVNDIWTIPGEEPLLEKYQSSDVQLFKKIDPILHFHRLQIKDFIQAVKHDQDPEISGIEGRKVVEIFTAVYRSTRDKKPIHFPLDSEDGFEDFDGRLLKK